MARRRRKPAITHKKSGAPDPDMPSLLELERFDEASFKQWKSAGAGLDALYTSLYFDLEPARQRDGQRQLDAVRRVAIQDFHFDGWCRIVDYQYSLTPLSTAGSVRSVGGRFNLGQDIAPGSITPFPALYIAEDYPTAFREKFGLAPGESRAGMSARELALRVESSFTSLRLRGVLDFVIDAGDTDALQPFVEVIRQYALPKSAVTNSRKLAMKSPPLLIRSAASLQRQLLHRNWRSMPVQFSIPANSQIFGRVASAAGLHGILYPSARNSDKRCLALFPQNWKGSGSHVELIDPPPVATVDTRLDGGPLRPL